MTSTTLRSSRRKSPACSGILSSAQPIVRAIVEVGGQPLGQAVLPRGRRGRHRRCRSPRAISRSWRRALRAGPAGRRRSAPPPRRGHGRGRPTARPPCRNCATARRRGRVVLRVGGAQRVSVSSVLPSSTKRISKLRPAGSSIASSAARTRSTKIGTASCFVFDRHDDGQDRRTRLTGHARTTSASAPAQRVLELAELLALELAGAAAELDRHRVYRPAVL